MYPFRSTYLPNFQCLLQFTPIFYHLINNEVLYLPNSASLAPRLSSSWAIQLVHMFLSAIRFSCRTSWSWKSCRNVPSQCRLWRGNLQDSLLHTGTAGSDRAQLTSRNEAANSGLFCSGFPIFLWWLLGGFSSPDLKENQLHGNRNKQN